MGVMNNFYFRIEAWIKGHDVVFIQTNVIRVMGDLAHVHAIVVLLAFILKTKSCPGISGKSQLLLALVFTTRYLDVFVSCSFISVYNLVLKILFTLSSYIIVYLIHIKFKDSYKKSHDSFWMSLLLILAGTLAWQINYELTVIEYLWTFSIYLEAYAIIPQIVMIMKSKQVEPIVLTYLSSMAWYKTFYVINWVYRYNTQGFYDLIATTSGCVQTLLIWTGVVVCHVIRSSNKEDCCKEVSFRKKSFDVY